MKRLVLMLALLAFASCAREGYVIDGRIDGLEGNISLVDMFDHVIASTTIKGGRFRFEGAVETPQLMYINNGLGQEYPMDTPVLVENVRIRVRGDVQTYDISVSGTPANENMTEYIRKKKQLDEMDIESYASLIRETFYDNHDNLLGAMLISNLAPYVSSEELLACCEMLPDYLRGSKIVNHYETFARAKVNTAVGQRFSDFEIMNQDGKSVTLSSAVESNEVTVLVVWATWARLASNTLSSYVDICRPYESRGLSMFCVSLDYNKSAWTLMSKETGIFGINICDTTEKGQEIADLYGIDGMPRAVVIDGDGTIIGRCYEETELEEVLKGHFDNR